MGRPLRDLCGAAGLGERSGTGLPPQRCPLRAAHSPSPLRGRGGTRRRTRDKGSPGPVPPGPTAPGGGSEPGPAGRSRHSRGGAGATAGAAGGPGTAPGAEVNGAGRGGAVRGGGDGIALAAPRLGKRKGSRKMSAPAAAGNSGCPPQGNAPGASWHGRGSPLRVPGVPGGPRAPV